MGSQEVQVWLLECVTVSCPQAAKDILRADDDTVSSLLGGLVLGTGVVGTLGGGMCHACHPCLTYD